MKNTNTLKCYSRDEAVREFKSDECKVIVLPRRDLNYKLKLVSDEDWEKKV